MNLFEFLLVPTILFMVVVAPVWLHYRSVNRSSRGLNAEDRDNFERLLETVDTLSERIATLEALLDAEHGDWRESDATPATPATPAKRSYL